MLSDRLSGDTELPCHGNDVVELTVASDQLIDLIRAQLASAADRVFLIPLGRKHRYTILLYFGSEPTSVEIEHDVSMGHAARA